MYEKNFVSKNFLLSFLVFSKWKPNDEAIVTHDLLIERPRNDTEHLRSKRSIPLSQAYPVNLNSGATRCWIPGYTGAHCEFRKFYR